MGWYVFREQLGFTRMEQIVFVFITFRIVCVHIRYHKYLTYLADTLKLLVKDSAIFCT
jgi:hypothetical protein